MFFALGFRRRWILRLQRKHLAATLTFAIAMCGFYFAANSSYGVFTLSLFSRLLVGAIFARLRPQDQIVQ